MGLAGKYGFPTAADCETLLNSGFSMHDPRAASISERRH